MKIEIIDNLKEKEFCECELKIEGIVDPDTKVFRDISAYHLETKNEKLLNEIKTWSIKKFSESKIFAFQYLLKRNTYLDVHLYFILNEKKSSKLEICFTPMLEKWNKPFSFLEYSQEIEGFCNEKLFFDSEEQLAEGFSLIIPVENEIDSISESVDCILQCFNEIENNVEGNLLEKVSKTNLITYFNFPAEYETACKQYLIYFTDFLRDLGIRAESNLSTNYEQTIFTVTPKDSTHGLELIRETLSLYLSFPTVNELTTINILNEDIAIQQLLSNVQFLKSQLLLGNALLQAKDATIESLELTKYQLKQVIDSKEKEIEKLNEGEDLVNGLVKVNKLKHKGFTVDLPEILRRIKRRF